MARDKVIALTATSERPASTLSGYPMLVVAVLAIAIDIYGIVQVANSDSRVAGLAGIVVGTLLFVLILPGFYMNSTRRSAWRRWSRAASRACIAVTARKIAIIIPASEPAEMKASRR